MIFLSIFSNEYQKVNKYFIIIRLLHNKAHIINKYYITYNS